MVFYSVCELSTQYVNSSLGKHDSKGGAAVLIALIVVIKAFLTIITLHGWEKSSVASDLSAHFQDQHNKSATWNLHVC